MLNPLELPGPDFLVIYALLAAAALVWAVVVRTPVETAVSDSINHAPLDPAMLAYLAGGPQRLGSAAMLGLLVTGSAEIDRRHRIQVVPTGADLPGWLEPFRAYEQERTTLARYVRSRRPSIDQLRDRLVGSGLALSAQEAASIAKRSVLPLACVIALGVAKFIFGVQHERPVGYLAILLGVSALVALLLLLVRPYRTAAGKAALAVARVQHARAARAPLPDEVLLAFALAGAAALAGTEWEAFRTMLTPSGDGGGCSGGDGGGGGGCGGGGGGCGG